jgi:hypothetical protein
MSEIPHQSPQPVCMSDAVDGSVTDASVRFLRWSLLGFGLVGFVTPLALASQTCGIHVDPIAVAIGVVGATVTRRSFTTFPWTAVFSLLYPLVFVAGCFSPEVSDYRYWFVPRPGFDAPHVFYLVLAAWACVNIGLICRFHRLQKRALRQKRPWQFSLRLLFAVTALLAIVLSIGTWYYRLSQPPPWGGRGRGTALRQTIE